ncbi:MAG: hypothetical protein CDV28_15312 [Candidatus Electronema aureum]|uniref:Uncharacterized protein n=1 Tax=Candidatus Electronema aureum TaxID=2005002 RepID=A0A521FYM0_9BACT|nr:MAG: hypothetical protein CDV28_15312 [Candidatus Electronema aureum]
MTTIQWRPAVNALTTPSSYRMLFLPRNVVDTPELAARIAVELPNYSTVGWASVFLLAQQ